MMTPPGSLDQTCCALIKSLGGCVPPFPGEFLSPNHEAARCSGCLFLTGSYEHIVYRLLDAWLRRISCTSGILGASRTFAPETCDRRASHFKIVEFEFDALAFLQVVDTDTIQCIRTKKEFIPGLSGHKATTKLSQDLCDRTTHRLLQQTCAAQNESGNVE
jgi:hypothetical protein